jgi:hypothetical protein
MVVACLFYRQKPTMWINKTRKNPTARLPYAYKPVEEGSLQIIPDPDVVPLVEQAMDHLDEGYSTRKVAEWLSNKVGRSISGQGISNIWKLHRPNSKRVKELKKAHRKKPKPITASEKEEARLKRKISDSKRIKTMMENRLADKFGATEEAEEEYQSISDTLDFGVITQETQEREVIFQPNPGPQTDFLAASEREVLYGGAAGGGKSYALLADPMRYFSNENFSGLILRRTNDELRELVSKSQSIYPLAYPGAKWQEKKSQWIFPSGARLWMTYLERDEDVMRYQGQAFSYIGVDELTQYATSYSWGYLRSRLRTTDPTLPLFMRATTNPGGRGHGWVKKMFIDPAPSNKKFAATDIETGQELTYPSGHEKAGEPLFYRRFIPANLRDNPYLEQDGQYEANLLALPEMQRRQLLDGDWSVADGAAFSEFRQANHVCEPFDIPDDWRRFRSCDYGYSSYSAVHWFAIDPSYETLYVYRELYVSKHTGKDLARAVMEAERGESIHYGVLDSSCWHNRGQIGPSIAEEMISMGCRWRPSDRSAGARVAGKNRFHEVLKVNEETETAGIVFFNTCRQIIADLPVIPSDPKGSDDIDPRYATDHAYDSVRYGIMSRPKAFSPFDMGRGVPIQRYTPSDSRFGY